jgi:hypothetical protein
MLPATIANVAASVTMRSSRTCCNRFNPESLPQKARAIRSFRPPGPISVEHAEHAVFTSEDPRFEDPDQIISEIAAGAEQAGYLQGTHFVMIEDRRAAIDHAIAQARQGDTVVLAGKGHETCMIYGSQRIPWNEARVARQVLEAHGYHPYAPETEG